MLIARPGVSSAQQISIGRIDQMPNKPSPYLMRNWKQVAIGYDSLVFNPNVTGTYLPLVSVGQNFSLASYVGQNPSQTKEAINCLPAVLGASLVGVDKTNQFGINWVSECQNWFNQNPQEDVYLNNPGGSSGSDWWYDVMPNIFFYQLYSLYPTVGNFQNQFVTVASRWFAALNAMGGSTTPWSLANLNHTAWNLSTMTPTNSTWVEPEAGGSIAWLLYSAYVQTGNTQFRIGAELAMESLLAYPVNQNPSYELQLPYGAYIAARMNAELGTTYDIGKLVTWCFSDGSDNSRLWGVTVGNWGGYDCDGLIGETGYGSGNGYPFTMNTFEQVGALVPLVRYDARFARIIGKWVLNASNAARLFYTKYLPDSNQDAGAAWSHQYDPNSYIAHESMHQHNPINPAVTPYETGDAIQNGNPTNFALYGSSHVGIFGAIIDTTDVPMILKLDVLKTDYFHAPAYPTYLLFNPDSVQRSVSFDAGSGEHDLYDNVSHAYILTSVSGVVSLPIGANSAVLVVNLPASVTPTYDLDRMLVNGIVADYHSGHPVANYPPRIKSLSADTATLLLGRSTMLFCTAVDRDSDAISYSWNASGGSIAGSGALVTWHAPDTVGKYTVQCIVSDTHTQTQATDTLSVVQFINHPPVIQKMNAVPGKINLGATSTIRCIATDPDSNTLTYHWSAASGVVSGAGSSVSWQAPQNAGNYFILCTVDDGYGGSAEDSVGLEVRDFSNWQTGSLVAYYPFSGDTKDASGNHHDGTASGGSFTSDRFGRSASAYFFDGSSSSIDVPDDSALNFQNGITVNFWITPRAFYSSREQYPISHGSWQNRWKFSISPNSNKIRWTVRNSQGTPKDLDAATPLALDSVYNVTGTYNGSDIEIYLNGQLDAFGSFSGAINSTSYDLAFGQDFPGDNNYDFNGVLDDIRIYNYMLPVSQISSLYDVNAGVGQPAGAVLPTQFALGQNFPNPFNPSTTIRFAIPSTEFVTLKIFDLLGREISTLVHDRVSPGEYSVAWNAAGRASGVYYYKLETASAVLVKKMILLR